MTLRLRTKLYGLTAVAVGIVAFASSAVLAGVHARSADAVAAEEVRAASRAFRARERADVQKLGAAVDALHADEALRRAFVARDRDALLRLAAPVLARLRERSDVTHLYFIEPDHRCFLRVHAPALSGDIVDRLTLSLADRSGDLAAGPELGRTAFALRAVRPWRDAAGNVVGYLELAEEVGHFLARLKEDTGDEVALVVKKELLDARAWTEVSGPARNTWNDRPDVVVIDTTTFSQGLVDFQGSIDAFADGGVVLERRRQSGRAFVRGAFPLRDASGHRMGAAFVLRDVTAVERALAVARARGRLALLGACALAGALVVAGLEALLFRRLAGLRAALEREADAGHVALAATLAHGDELRRIELLATDRRDDGRARTAAGS